MRKQKILRYAAGLLTVLAAVAAVHTQPVQAVSGQRTVRVAYPLQEGNTDLTGQGEYCGYTYEYLEEIAQYTGWNYEFVQVPGTSGQQFSTLLEMLKNGEVDLMGTMIYSKDLDEDCDYSANNYGMIETVLKVPVESGADFVIDSSRKQTIRVAVRSKYGREAGDLNEYCKMNLLSPVFVECDSGEEVLRALREGRADVALGTSMNYSDEMRTVASFSPRQIYFVAPHDSGAELLNQLNRAMASINQTDPYFQSALYDKFFVPQARQLILSDEEQAYIQATGNLNVGVLNNHPPFQYEDSGKRGMKGIGVDLLQQISEKTGLHFTMVAAGSEEQLDRMALDGQIDMVAGMPYSYVIAEERNLSMTRPYATSPYTLLLNEDIGESSIKGKRLALSKASRYHGYFVGKVEYYDTVKDCIGAVNSGQADYTYVDTYTAQYYINLPEYDQLKMVPQTYESSKTCFGIVAPSDHTLAGILNKAILSMSVEELQSVIYMNTIQKQAFSIGYFIQKNPVQVILACSSIFLIILLLLLTILYQRIRSAKATKLELQRYMRLYSVSNDYIFEYDYKKSSLMLNMPESMTGRQRIKRYDLSRNSADVKQQLSRDAMMRLLEGKESRIVEERLCGMDSRWHWFRIVLEVIRDDMGKPVYAIGRLNVIDDEKKEREALMEKAQRDSLTHLYNTESCQKLAAARLAELKDGETGALLVLDVDKFKMINDTYGHMRGDEILREVADLLKRSFRSDDIVGRPGGDEFTVYMTLVRDRAALEEKCASVCGRVREITLDSGHHLTISLGAAMSHPGQSYGELYRIADQALYKAKGGGRDGFRIGDAAEGTEAKI